MTHDDLGMVECPTCGGPGCIPEDEADRIEAALTLVASIPTDRLNPWHTLIVRARSWHLTHPLTCDLATCGFDERARTWARRPTRAGTYRWHSPDGPLVPEETSR